MGRFAGAAVRAAWSGEPFSQHRHRIRCLPFHGLGADPSRRVQGSVGKRCVLRGRHGEGRPACGVGGTRHSLLNSTAPTGPTWSVLAVLVNFPATGTTAADQGALSVKAVDDSGELIGGLSAWTWGGLLGIEMLWVREESRQDGWGSKLLLSAEAEARRRGCDRACVSSFTFQAPAFYQRHGYAETGRTLGIPGGAEDVHMYKKLS